MNSLRHLIARRAGGSNSRISPESATRPSGSTRLQAPPTFHSASARTPSQYCGMKSEVVSAFQSASGVVRM